ncbi:MAG TPA: hypothetical protein PK500_01810 [Candidatus Egerieousia sp.]|nr:hypothetical protein [Candidatus Egerieousia sp.]HPT05376.1 hypothetical protein [Candidatus Egerieousia sp.]
MGKSIFKGLVRIGLEYAVDVVKSQINSTPRSSYYPPPCYVPPKKQEAPQPEPEPEPITEPEPQPEDVNSTLSTQIQAENNYIALYDFMVKVCLYHCLRNEYMRTEELNGHLTLVIDKFYARPTNFNVIFDDPFNRIREIIEKIGFGNNELIYSRFNKLYNQIQRLDKRFEKEIIDRQLLGGINKKDLYVLNLIKGTITICYELFLAYGHAFVSNNSDLIIEYNKVIRSHKFNPKYKSF